MQQTVYKCDFDKKEIGPKVHISLVMQTNHPGNGIAMPPTPDRGGWKTAKMPASFVHFCNPECMKKYFSNLYKAAEAAQKTKHGNIKSKSKHTE